MVNKKFLLEHNLVEAYNKFMHLCNETTYFSGNLDEEGEDEDPNAQGGGDMGGEPMPQDGEQGAPMDAPQGQDMNGGEMPPMGNEAPQGGDDNAAFDPSQQPPMDAPQGGDMMQGGDMGGEPIPPMGDEIPPEEEEEDSVIDVDDITNAQEKTNSKVNKVGRNLGKVDDKIMSLMDTIKSLQAMIDDNNARIDSFKAEFERRNPTPTEKLNLRSLDSYPFNANPKDYWQGKATQTDVSGKRYEAYADNEEPVAKQEYTITQDDVDDYTDNAIRDSFHISDDLRSTIEKIFDI